MTQLETVLAAQNHQNTNTTKTSLLHRSLFHLKNLNPKNQANSPPPKTFKTQDLTALHDGLSYCTWNSLGRNLNSTSILSALSILATHGLEPTNLIIDDNWQPLDTGPATNIYNDTNKHRWTDFPASSANFPQGLAHLVQQIRKQHPHIRHIAVWHGLFGYWGGIAPHGAIAKRYKTQVVTRQTGEYYLHGGKIIAVNSSDVARLYDDFYAYLASCGIDAVKTDTQFYPDYLEHAPDRLALIDAYQNAWLTAAGKHFGHRAIACMAQTPQILFRSFLTQDGRPPYLFRNSDDFAPESKGPGTQAWHLFCNAHNAVLTQHLNVLPDWDMFQTTGPWAAMHAASRCLSGGPVYVTDVPGQHDMELIKQMTAVGRDGHLRVLRPEGKGRAVEIYEKRESGRFLKVGSGHQGVGLLEVFNLGEREGMNIITRRSFVDFSGEEDAEWLVKRHVADTVQVLDGQNGAVVVALKQEEYEILIAYPITSHGGIRFVVLGLLGKMTGVAALSSSPAIIVAEDALLCVKVSLKAKGVLGIWLENAHRYLVQDLMTATLLSENVRVGLKVVKRLGDVVGVNLESVQLEEGEGVEASNRDFEVEIRIKSLVKTSRG